MITRRDTEGRKAKKTIPHILKGEWDIKNIEILYQPLVGEWYAESFRLQSKAVLAERWCSILLRLYNIEYERCDKGHWDTGCRTRSITRINIPIQANHTNIYYNIKPSRHIATRPHTILPNGLDELSKANNLWIWRMTPSIHMVRSQ